MNVIDVVANASRQEQRNPSNAGRWIVVIISIERTFLTLPIAVLTGCHSIARCRKSSLKNRRRRLELEDISIQPLRLHAF